MEDPKCGWNSTKFVRPSNDAGHSCRELITNTSSYPIDSMDTGGNPDSNLTYHLDSNPVQVGALYLQRMLIVTNRASRLRKPISIGPLINS